MNSNTVERVTEWNSEPFTDGYDGLHELADREFSGAVTNGESWLFMLNGRGIGVFDGEMDGFAEDDGTAYTAPDPALPLLFAMQHTGGETRAEYYSEDTPLSEVNNTLESGNFTGYVELSENVLSGDYYVAYYGGKSMSVAFVGNNAERLTGDEAFERADDEVGIYEVNTVDLDIIDIPGGDAEDASSGGAASPSGETGATSAEEPAEGDTTAEPIEDAEAESGGTETASADSTAEGPADTDRTAESESQGASPRATAEGSGGDTGDSGTQQAASESGRAADSGGQPAGGAGTAAEQRWRGAKTIPALDPAESVDMAEQVPGGVEPAGASAAGAGRQAGASVEALRDERNRLQERVTELQGENDQLRSENDRLQSEREEAEAKADELEREIEELQSEVERLESELSDAESDLSEVEDHRPKGDHEVSADRALTGTNLFVRYDRQGGATLEDAHDGAADRADVNANLRLEQHTDFEARGAVVDGNPYDEWLEGTTEYGFAGWLVQEFIHDVLETGSQSALGKLFDAIPDIDRVEFQGSVELPGEQDEEAPAKSVTFDVILRDRMGDALVVADLNDSREPATDSMLATLIENATPVAKAQSGLAAAFFVTTSYYEPDALETAESSTGTGILSRDPHESFVKLSRKGGYHLCLVESGDDEFHVSVPEL